jgi:hypothetical protein
MLLALALTLAAAQSRPAGLVGRWDVIGPARQAQHERPCESGTDQVIFDRHGRWEGVAIGDTGTWWMRGGKLYQRTLDPGGGGDPADRGKIDVQRIRQVREGVYRFADGTLLVRCSRAAR